MLESKTMPRCVMKFPRRAELWLLFALVVAGLIFVFASRKGGDDSAGPGGTGTAAPSEERPLKLHRCVVERDYGNARLDIDLQLRNDTAEALALQPPKVRLLAAKGREIPPFFLPFEKQPEIPAHTSQVVQLRYWLDASDLQGALELEVDRRIVEVKGAKPFDLATLKNGEKKALGAGEW